MMRWVLLSILVIALATLATVLAQYVPTALPEDDIKFPTGARGRTADPSARPPKAVVEGEPTYEFGTMSQWSTGSHSWTVKNEGPSDLTLELNYTSCSCTLASVGDSAQGEKDKTSLTADPEGEKPKWSSVVKPGESKVITLTWNTKDRSGKYGQRAEILTNDPEHPKLTFAAQGMVSPAIVTVPRGDTLQFGRISNEEVNKTIVSLFSPDKPDLEVSEPVSSRPEVLAVSYQPLSEQEMKILEVPPGSNGYRVDVEIKPTMPLGSFNEQVIVKTNHPKRPQVTFAVQGYMSGPVSVTPDHVTMANVSGRRGQSLPVTIWVRGREDARVEVANSPEKLKVTLAPVDDKSGAAAPDGTARSFRMIVAVPPGTPSGTITGAIVLKTNHPKAGEVKVPVYAVVTGG